MKRLILFILSIIPLDTLAQSLTFPGLKTDVYIKGADEVRNYTFQVTGLTGTEKAYVQFDLPITRLIQGTDYTTKNYVVDKRTKFELSTGETKGYEITFKAQPSGEARILMMSGRWKVGKKGKWKDFYVSPLIVHYLGNGASDPASGVIYKQPYLEFYGIFLAKLEEYDCTSQAVQPDALDSNLTVVFSNVVLGSNDVIKTGMAASLVQDKDKGTLSFNATIPSKNTKWFFGPADGAWNVGFVGKTSGGIYQLFGKDSWSREIGVNGGYTWIPHRGSQFFSSSECAKLKATRNQASSSLLSSYYKAINEDESTLMRDSANYASITSFDNQFDNAQLKKDYEPVDSTRKSINSRLKNYRRIHDGAINAAKQVKYDYIKELITADLTKFDQANDVLTGYRVKFFDLKVGISNNTLNLSTDSLGKSDLKLVYKDKPLLKFNAQASFNYTYLSTYKPNSAGTMFFFQANFLFERGSFLDVPSFAGKAYALRDTSIGVDYVINPETRDTLGKGSELNLPVCILTPSIYAAGFFGKGQQLGWDIRASYRWALDPYLGNKVQSTYTILTGPVFRIATEKEFSKATIGIKTGISNAPVSPKDPSRLWKDFFTLRFEIGVPFKWYYKEPVKQP